MTVDPADLRFLNDLTRDVVEASRVRPGQRIGDSAINSTGITLIRPGGRACYPAMWPRDFSMSLDSGLITTDEAMQHLRLIAQLQNGPKPRKLRSGAVIGPFAIPDHINFDGSAVFYPGTMSAGEDQGGEPFGIAPPIDNNFEFIHIACWIQQKTHETAFLNEVIAGMPLHERLVRAFDAIGADETTGGMVTTAARNRAVGFGFCDIVYLTGAMLFPSLLRYRAAREITRLSAAFGRELKPESAIIATTMASHFSRIFSDPAHRGWLLAATDIGRRPDVWGTCFALTLGVLDPDEARAARTAVTSAIHAGTITLHGAVRHVPTDADASATSAWDRVAPGFAVNTYQNGAYWHTPTGWLLAAIQKYEPVLARKLFEQFIAHLREQDFRKGPSFGAPWECFACGGAAKQNPVYMASVALPLGVLNSLEA
jgi:hypothetical protein